MKNEKRKTKKQKAKDERRREEDEAEGRKKNIAYCGFVWESPLKSTLGNLLFEGPIRKCSTYCKAFRVKFYNMVFEERAHKTYN